MTQKELIKYLRDRISTDVPYSVFENFLGALTRFSKNPEASFTVTENEENGIIIITIKYVNLTEQREDDDTHTIKIDNKGNFFVLNSEEKQYPRQKGNEEKQPKTIKEEEVTLKFATSLEFQQGWIVESISRKTDATKVNRNGIYNYQMTDKKDTTKTYYNDCGVAMQEQLDTVDYFSRNGDSVTIVKNGTSDQIRYMIKTRTGFNTCKTAVTIYIRGELVPRKNACYATINTNHNMGNMISLTPVTPQKHDEALATAKAYTEEAVLKALENTEDEITRTSLIMQYYPGYYKAPVKQQTRELKPIS